VTDFKIKSESKREYEEDAKKYFRNIGAPKVNGRSAEDYREVEARLPGPAKKQQILERYTKGFSKSSRSGAFSKPNAGPAIFPSGLKFASDFIDEMTPKGIKQPVQPKPDISKEAKPTGGFLPKARAVIDDVCLDCLKELTKDDWVLGVYIVTEQDDLKLFAMHVYNGALVNYAICKKCFDYALEMGKEATPIVLVSGNLIPEKDREIAAKYGFPVNIHDGQERTMGQLNMIKRIDRLKTNLENYLISLPLDSKVFRDVEQRSADGQGYSRDLAALN
jgi:hypothetical protein